MITGVIITTIGTIIRLWAISSMRGKFTFKIKVPDKICKTGAYKYIRHPSYVGSVLVLCGLFIINPIMGFCYLAFVFFLARAVQEESILSQYRDYIEYKKKTGMFIPRINHGNTSTTDT